MKGAMAILASIVAAMALSVPIVHAEPTRGQYVAQAEPLCKAMKRAVAKQSRKLNMRVKKDFPGRKAHPKEGTPADKKLTLRIFDLLGRTDVFTGRKLHHLDRKLVTLPPPPADAAVIDQWIESRRVDANHLKHTGKRFKRVKRVGKDSFLKLFIGSLSLEDQFAATDAIASDIGFQACLLAPELQPTL